MGKGSYKRNKELSKETIENNESTGYILQIKRKFLIILLIQLEIEH